VNRDLAKRVANAVLYEGYMLYPYRPSAIKNRQRWSFGILYPPAYPEVRIRTERAVMRSECLLLTNAEAKLGIEVRFLHLVARQIEQSIGGRLAPVMSLVVDGRLWESWDEGVERSVNVELVLPKPGAPQCFEFSFAGTRETESLEDRTGHLIGRVNRTQHQVTGTVSVSGKHVREGVLKLVIEVANETPLPPSALDRNAALLRSLLSAHTIVTVNGGEFVSLLDPPKPLRDEASLCKNVGNFPVLVGAQDERSMLLCSPILLYDYPQIAPESTNDFYDATEIDEMLTLRLMTLTDHEKAEMRIADERVRALLERAEENASAQLMRTHGAIRSLRPVNEEP
jgi:hypothetical protein